MSIHASRVAQAENPKIDSQWKETHAINNKGRNRNIHLVKRKRVTPSLNVELASSAEDIKAAQRLRYRIFAEEMGADVKGSNEGLDRDYYDDYCHHLLVRNNKTQEIIGCTRILTEKNAQLAGSFYSASEFDMQQTLASLKGNIIEIGRTCIHPDYRNGAGIAVLWSGLAQFMQIHQTDYMLGCASISMADGGIQTQAIMQKIREKHLSPEAFRVQPRHTLSNQNIATPTRLQIPPLLKAYLRLGAWVAGEPCLDPAFNVADVFILLDVDNLNARYHRHFIKGSAHYGIRSHLSHAHV